MISSSNLLCVNIINLLFWRPLILGPVPVYCAPPAWCSCVQLYLDYRDTPLPPAGYTSLDRHFAETTENFQLLVIWNLTIPGIRMIFRFFNWRLRSRLCFTEFCSDTNLEVSKIIWNRKMISISQTHFLTVSMSGFLLGTCWVLELFYRQEVSGEVRQISICISSISNISNISSILPVP